MVARTKAGKDRASCVGSPLPGWVLPSSRNCLVLLGVPVSALAACRDRLHLSGHGDISVFLGSAHRQVLRLCAVSFFLGRAMAILDYVHSFGAGSVLGDGNHTRTRHGPPQRRIARRHDKVDRCHSGRLVQGFRQVGARSLQVGKRKSPHLDTGTRADRHWPSREPGQALQAGHGSL